MNKLIFAITFAMLTTQVLAEEAKTQLGENQAPPAKSSASGCKYARKSKAIDASTASKTQKVKKSSAQTLGE